MDINISIGLDSKKGGLMGVSLDEIRSQSVIKKKKRKKRKDHVTKSLESGVKAPKQWTTEVV